MTGDDTRHDALAIRHNCDASPRRAAAGWLMPLAVCAVVFSAGYSVGSGGFIGINVGSTFAPLSASKVGSINEFVQKVPDNYEVVLHFLPKDAPAWKTVWAFTVWRTRPCVIYLNAADWTIYAKPLLSKARLSPLVPPLSDVIAHELLHCLRGAWHPAWR